MSKKTAPEMIRPRVDRSTAIQGLTFREPLLWERSRPGRHGDSIPEDFDDPQGLLHQADLFMMEDLKSAVGLLFAKNLSLETLKETPARAGLDVRASLLDFHARYYSS